MKTAGTGSSDRAQGAERGVRGRPAGVPAGKTSARQLAVTARRAKVLELRVSGMTERAIADQVGAAPSTVHVDLVEAVDRWGPWEQAAEWQVLTVRRLELAMCRWWRLAMDEDAVVVVADDEGRERFRPATTSD